MVVEERPEVEEDFDEVSKLYCTRARGKIKLTMNRFAFQISHLHLREGEILPFRPGRTSSS